MEFGAVAEIYMAKKVWLDLYKRIAVYLNAFKCQFSLHISQ